MEVEFDETVMEELNFHSKQSGLPVEDFVKYLVAVQLRSLLLPPEDLKTILDIYGKFFNEKA